MPGVESDRCVLRLQGLPDVGAATVRHHRPRLCDALAGLGSGRRRGACRSSKSPVPLIYLDESRAFGGALDDADYRLKHYRRVFEEALERAGLVAAAGCLG